MQANKDPELINEKAGQTSGSPAFFYCVLHIKD